MNSNANSPLTEDDAAKALVSDIDSLEAELIRQEDLYRRLAADFDNFRKRTVQEIDRRAAAQKDGFIKDLLPIIDNLERALVSGDAATADQLREGVRLTLRQMYELLRRHGIEPDQTSGGQPFDPRRHDAIAVKHDPSQADHAILEVLQQGYRRGKEAFRPAKVVVNDLGSEETTGEAG